MKRRVLVPLVFLHIVVFSVSIAFAYPLIRVIGDVAYPPFEYLNPDGIPEGYLVDLWTAITEKTGIAHTYQLTVWKDALNMLQEHEADVIGGVFKTPEREAIFEFSHPFFEITTHIFFQEGMTGIRTIEDLQGFIVGVVEGDASQAYLERHLTNGYLKLFDGWEDLIKAALSEEVKVFVMDKPTALYFLALHKAGDAIRYQPEPLYLEAFHMITAKGNTELIHRINQGLAQITPQEMKSLEDRWMGKEIEGPSNLIRVLWFILISVIVMISMIVWNLLLKKKIRNAVLTIQEQNRDLQHQNEQLQRNKDELNALNEELHSSTQQLEASFAELEAVNRGMEQIIEVTARMSEAAKENDESFLTQLLEMLLVLVPRADYGSLSLVEDGQWRFVHAVGHDLERLKKLELKSIYLMEIEKAAIFPNILEQNRKVLDDPILVELNKATLPIKESIISALRFGGNHVGNMALDIGEGKSERFQEKDVTIVNAFSNVASSFIGMQRYMIEQGKFQKQLLMAMIQILEIYDPYTHGHSEKVAEYSALIAQDMGMKKEQIQRIYWAGLVHDIGKILVPQGILSKPDKLTYNEFETIKSHPEWGARVLQTSEELQDIVESVLYHHERWDGRGYPEGKKGEDIPMNARIIGMADAYDAMISDRPYRVGLKLDEAIEEIRQNSGKQFDPTVVEVFLRHLYKNRMGANSINRKLNGDNQGRLTHA